MRGLKKLMAGVALSASFLMASAAQAMPIAQFDTLTNSQKGDFGGYLVQSAYNMLKAQGNTADAEKVLTLLSNKTNANDFIETINSARKINQDNANDPNFKPLQVEHAFSLVLKQHGIIVPVRKLLQVTEAYKLPSPSTNQAALNHPLAVPHGQ